MATKAAGANWTHSICFRRHQLLKKTTIVHRHTAERTAACSGCIHSYQVEIEKATWRRVRDVEDGEPRSHGGTRFGDGGKRILYMDGDG